MTRQSTSLRFPGKDRRKGAAVCTLGLALLLAIACPGTARAIDPADLPNAIESAETAADHEALAAYFEGEAKAAREMAERHRRMGERYRNLRKPAGLKGVRARIDQSMPRHCDKLVASYEAAASEYEAMAAEHREAASEIE